ncbi:MAG: LPXTG cell wall anchor domain-containing protein [Acidobacteriaceae bacterium]
MDTGIVVRVVAGLLFLAVLGLLVMRRKKKSI